MHPRSSEIKSACGHRARIKTSAQASRRAFLMLNGQTSPTGVGGAPEHVFRSGSLPKIIGNLQQGMGLS